MTKSFTPLEATRTLPLVRRIVADLLERGRELRALSQQAELGADDEARADALSTELDQLREELEALGCSFRSPDYAFGLVDFPGVIDGRPVCLCWRDDEPDLRWYHEPDAGFAGRRPIPERLLAPS